MQRLIEFVELYNPDGGNPDYMQELLLSEAPEAIPKLLEHELASLKDNPTDTKAKVALSVLAPLAHRLNMHATKQELEDTAFRLLHPEQYALAVKLLRQNEADTSKPLLKFIHELREKLALTGVKAVDISGRTKQPYSLYKKLRKAGTISDVHDLLAVRIVVDTEESCYQVLDIINKEFHPRLERFKDYIKQPKPNGYRSLHVTLVIGKKTLEVQIRTPQMHEHAEGGSAAHWQYDRHKLTKNYLRGIGADEGGGAQEYVYAFSPSGDIFRLKQGATVLDFAFAVHTGIGLRTRSIKVNGDITPLDSLLVNGDRVEVLTGKEARPTQGWLRFVSSRKAAQRIRSWLKQAERDRFIARGRELLQERFNEKLPAELADLPSQYKLRQLDDLLLAVGAGHITVESIERRLSPPEPKVATVVTTGPSRPVVIAGMEELQYRLARCCRPAHPRPIIGYITRSLGITVHASDCKELVGEEERTVVCRWG